MSIQVQTVVAALVIFSSLAGAVFTLLAFVSGARRAAGDSPAARVMSGALAAILVAWFAIVAAVAYAGGFSGRPGQPPIAMALGLAVPLTVGVAAIWLIPALGRTLAAPALQPSLIAVHSFRLVEGVVFLALIPLGQLPALFAIPAGAGDALVGLTALWMAGALRRGRNGATRAAVRWSLLGLLDLVVAIILGLATAPGPVNLIATTPSSLALTLAPLILVPAFYVPLSIWLHIVSLRFLLGRARVSVPAAAPLGDAAALAR